jgi:Family of unknown function (DUF5681)
MSPRLPKLRLPLQNDTFGTDASDEPSVTVGYGQPPVKSRFKAGQSGNPHGRPKGARNKMPALNEECLKSIIMAEAYRRIKVNDGPRQVSVPIVQAIVRSLAVNAVKGQHRSQRLFSELLGATERDNKALHDEWVKTAMEYKNNWEQAIEHCRSRGLPLPDPVPHPDHIDIDLRTGEIVIDGPFSRKQRDKGRDLIKRLRDCREELAWLREEREKTSDDEMRTIFDKDIDFETKLQTMIMDCIRKTPWMQREWVEAIKQAASKPKD